MIHVRSEEVDKDFLDCFFGFPCPIGTSTVITSVIHCDSIDSLSASQTPNATRSAYLTTATGTGLYRKPA